ncbi:MAG: hypothetical protein GYB21_19500 [Oceanospirillales bacterium]|nr:hypothetical protein [Oceanospirillales bacterium]
MDASNISKPIAACLNTPIRLSAASIVNAVVGRVALIPPSPAGIGLKYPFLQRWSYLYQKIRLISVIYDMSVEAYPN